MPIKPDSVEPDSASERRIINAWLRVAAPWAAAAREARIESRRLVTDRAIVDCVLARSPQRVLDIGCGEGWLARELAQNGVHVDGVDVAPELIASAREAGGERFEVMSYEAIADGAISDRYDACVCNFSLLGETSVERLVDAIPMLLTPPGVLIVQTLHPLIACGEHAYRDGWREGSWSGMGEGFGEAAPWYFRTLETWVNVYDSAGLRIVALHEPVHPVTAKPASLILVGGIAGAVRRQPFAASD